MTKINRDQLFESEKNIFRHVRNIDINRITIVADKSASSCKGYETLRSIIESPDVSWIDASGKADEPPDFYSDELKTMVEIMRVDDHAYLSEDGKIINHNAMAESNKFHELMKNNLVMLAPDCIVSIIADTGLPTLEDHNYARYVNNFKRVVEKHKTKIPQYKKNHPNCHKLAFIVMDESCGYFENATKAPRLEENITYFGKPHLWYLDDNFLKIIKETEVDCFIWYCPYKYAESRYIKGGLPEIVVFLDQTIPPTIHYDQNRVVPAEI